MQDRFKYKIAIFERYKTGRWEFLDFMEENDRWLLTCSGDIIHTGSYSIYHNRQNAPENVGRVYEPVFCTGLKDKNGNLIYEGDIIQFVDCHPAQQKEICNCGVFFTTRGAYYRCIPLDKISNEFTQHEINYSGFGRYGVDMCTGYSFLSGEIIGNIYENPELLEVLND